MGANGPDLDAEIPENNGVNGDLPYTLECPQSHEELLIIIKGIAVVDLPTVVSIFLWCVETLTNVWIIRLNGSDSNMTQNLRVTINPNLESLWWL